MILEKEGLEVMVMGVQRSCRPVLGRLHCIPVTAHEDLLVFGLSLLSDLSKVVEQEKAGVGVLWGIDSNKVCCGIMGIGNMNVHHIAIEGRGSSLGDPIPVREGVFDGQDDSGLGSLLVQCAGGKVGVSFKDFGHCSTPVVMGFEFGLS